MKFINNILLRVGRASLKRRRAGIIRNKKAHNFITAKTACIVYDGLWTTELSCVFELKEFLLLQGISVHLLIFIDSEKVPVDYASPENSTILLRKDTDIFYRPRKQYFTLFLNKKFDLLIDLCIKEYFPLQYLICLSKTSFKVGKYTEHINDYDLMINIGNNNSPGYLAEQIKHYVNLLNNPVMNPKIIHDTELF